MLGWYRRQVLRGMTRPHRTIPWRRAFAWAIAYAFVLQVILAPVAALAAAAHDSLDATAFVQICTGHPAAADTIDPARQAAQQDATCKHCIGCVSVAVLPPDDDFARAGIVAVTSRIDWVAATPRDPTSPLLSGRSARGPPQHA